MSFKAIVGCEISITGSHLDTCSQLVALFGEVVEPLLGGGASPGEVISVGWALMFYNPVLLLVPLRCEEMGVPAVQPPAMMGRIISNHKHKRTLLSSSHFARSLVTAMRKIT